METRSFADTRDFRPEKMSKVNLFETPRMFCDVYGLEPGQSQAPQPGSTPSPAPGQKSE